MGEPRPFDLAGFTGLHAAPTSPSQSAPVVFLHGTNQDHRHFADQMRYLSERGLDCYAFPRRGRDGIPPTDARGVTFEDYLSDTLRVIESFGSPPILVAHSFGGLLAQKVAEMGGCRAAVLLMPLAPRQLYARLIAPLPAIPIYLKIVPAVVSGASFAVSYPDLAAASLNRVPEAKRGAIFPTFVPESGVVARQVLLGIPIDAAKVTCPMLCVAGGDDRFARSSLVRQVAELYKADFFEAPDHGHFVMADARWEEIPEAILRWLASTGLLS